MENEKDDSGDGLAHIVPYKLVCKWCGHGKERGILEYLGNGEFTHIRGCDHVIRRESRARKPRSNKPEPKSEVDLCKCIAKQFYPFDCPYKQVPPSLGGLLVE